MTNVLIEIVMIAEVTTDAATMDGATGTVVRTGMVTGIEIVAPGMRTTVTADGSLVTVAGPGSRSAADIRCKWVAAIPALPTSRSGGGAA
ncbi:hypothetical protein [Pseudorhizobium tarimense]